MIKELFIRKPKFSVKEIAASIFAKLFEEEIKRSGKKIRKDLSGINQLVDREKLNLVLISLYVFAVDYSTFQVYGNSRIKNKIQDAFHTLIKQEFKGYVNYIFELAQRFSYIYRMKPEDPLSGLGLYFSKCINQNNTHDLLTAMIGTTETVKKCKLITGFYEQLNSEYKIY